MARTHRKYMRVYADGYDLSGQLSSIGPLSNVYDEGPFEGLSEEVIGIQLGHATNEVGNYNGVLDNTDTTGLHGLQSAPGLDRTMMIALGFLAPPVMGDPVFSGIFPQLDYMPNTGQVITTVTASFGPQSQESGMLYTRPWGKLLHALGAETGANSATTNVDNGAATTKGGYLVYQIMDYSGTGDAEISVDDSADGSTFTALSGATSGAIAHTAMPTAGIIQLATTATVRQYLRWQLALNTLTSVTFALAFVRG